MAAGGFIAGLRAGFLGGCQLARANAPNALGAAVPGADFARCLRHSRAAPALGGAAAGQYGARRAAGFCRANLPNRGRCLAIVCSVGGLVAFVGSGGAARCGVGAVAAGGSIGHSNVVGAVAAPSFAAPCCHAPHTALCGFAAVAAGAAVAFCLATLGAVAAPRQRQSQYAAGFFSGAKRMVRLCAGGLVWQL